METCRVSKDYLKTIWKVFPSCIIQLYYLLTNHPELIWLEWTGTKISLVYERANLINADRLLNIKSWERGLKHAGLTVRSTTHKGLTQKFWNVPFQAKTQNGMVKTYKKSSAYYNDVDAPGGSVHGSHPAEPANKKHDIGLIDSTGHPVPAPTITAPAIIAPTDFAPTDFAPTDFAPTDFAPKIVVDYPFSSDSPVSDEEIIQNIGAGTICEKAAGQSSYSIYRFAWTNSQSGID
jgi:hypothetical protein